MTPLESNLNSRHRLPKCHWWATAAALALVAPAPAGDDASTRYNPIAAAAKAAIQDSRTIRSKVAGWARSEGAFEDLPAEGAVLVGFELGVGRFVGSEVIYAVRPLFWTVDGVVGGQQHGPTLGPRAGNRRGKSPVERVVTVKARSGYAVAGLNS